MQCVAGAVCVFYAELQQTALCLVPKALAESEVVGVHHGFLARATNATATKLPEDLSA